MRWTSWMWQIDIAARFCHHTESYCAIAASHILVLRGMIELGGTIGDIESMPFIEALRSLKFQLPEKLGLNCCTTSKTGQLFSSGHRRFVDSQSSFLHFLFPRNSLAWCHCSYIPRLGAIAHTDSHLFDSWRAVFLHKGTAWKKHETGLKNACESRNMSGQKTKPTQHSDSQLKRLLRIYRGFNPLVGLCHITSVPLPTKVKALLGLGLPTCLLHFH